MKYIRYLALAAAGRSGHARVDATHKVGGVGRGEGNGHTADRNGRVVAVVTDQVCGDDVLVVDFVGRRRRRCRRCDLQIRGP